MNKLFNITLIKKEFKIQSAVFYVGLVYFFLNLPYYTIQQVINQTNSLIQNGRFPYAGETLDYYSVLGSSVTLMCIFGVTLGLSFAREKQKKTMEEIARMPYSRMQIYFSKVLVSMLVIALPLIINLILFFAVGLATEGFDIFIDKSAYINASISSIITSYYIYFYYVMISMLFGSVVGAFICGSIFMTFPFSLIGLVIINIFDSSNISLATERFLMNSLYYSPVGYLFKGVFEGESLIVVIALIMLYCIIGYHLFVIYKMERNSEFLTYTKIELLFKVGVFVCSVLSGRMLFDGLLASVATPIINQTIGVIIGGLLGYIIPKKIIDKSRVA